MQEFRFPPPKIARVGSRPCCDGCQRGTGCTGHVDAAAPEPVTRCSGGSARGPAETRVFHEPPSSRTPRPRDRGDEDEPAYHPQPPLGYMVPDRVRGGDGRVHRVYSHEPKIAATARPVPGVNQHPKALGAATPRPRPKGFGQAPSDSPDPPWVPPPRPFEAGPVPILPPGLGVAAPFRPPVPELPLGTPRRLWTAVDPPPAPGTPCERYTWGNAFDALNTHYRNYPVIYRRLKFSSCTPGAEHYVRTVWTQALCMADVALRVVRRYVYPYEGNYPLKPAVVNAVNMWNEMRSFWNEMGEETLGWLLAGIPRPPQYMDPRPVTWLGPFSWYKAERLYSVVANLRDQLAAGYNFKDSYTIWCAGGCGGSGACHGAKHLIQLTDRFFNWDDDSNSGNWQRTWFGRTEPCDAHRLLIHEVMHWNGNELNDQLYWHPQAERDRGPCPRDPGLGGNGRRPCRHGFCGTRLAHENNSYQANHNIDNYAYLIRNIALHWANEVFIANPGNFFANFRTLQDNPMVGGHDPECGDECGTRPIWDRGVQVPPP